MATSNKYDHIKLQTRMDGRSWAIVGVVDILTFSVIGVLDAPVTEEMARQIAQIIADKFANGRVVEAKRNP